MIRRKARGAILWLTVGTLALTGLAGLRLAVRGRELARQSACASNLRELGKAMEAYAAEPPPPPPAEE